MDLKSKSLRFTPKRIEALARLGICDTDGVLSYYPFRYDVMNTDSPEHWHLKEKVTFCGEVISAVRTFRFGRNRSSSKFDVAAYDRILHITIFNRPWARQLALNQTITVTGIYMGRNNVTAVTYNLKNQDEAEPVTPVYSVREGITQRTVRDSIRKVLDVCSDGIKDQVPVRFRRAYRLMEKRESLEKIHFPKSTEDVMQAQRSLKYEEFLRFFIAVEIMKNDSGSTAYKKPKKFDHEKLKKVIRALPFKMTPDQIAALADCIKDMESTHLMYRLIQGDVGCGKTLVAALALYACVLSGYQGALLAPTEILARQHFSAVQNLLKDEGVSAAVLYSGENAQVKNQILEDLSSGKIQIVIGTHSLIQESVKFHNLGLVVADEQQRFGVGQRRALRGKGDRVDFLLMSATPIPRTLASTLYGDMEISTIETMPPGRKPVITELITENSFRSVLNDVMSLLRDSRQLYVICAAVDKNEEYDARNVSETTANLKKLFEPEFRVGMLHGRMSSEEKQEVMRQFAENEIQVLVSTTVVEVGMNVVNATGMIIYDAERFGMSQIHQLRGRVQRGSGQGRCWLLTDSKDENALDRLNVLAATSDGFKISYEDLRLRGPGDILGTRQSGIPDFILGNLIQDTGIISQARKDAAEIMNDPDNPDFVDILDSVHETARRNANYAD